MTIYRTPSSDLFEDKIRHGIDYSQCRATLQLHACYAKPPVLAPGQHPLLAGAKQTRAQRWTLRCNRTVSSVSALASTHTPYSHTCIHTSSLYFPLRERPAASACGRARFLRRSPNWADTDAAVESCVEASRGSGSTTNYCFYIHTYCTMLSLLSPCLVVPPYQLSRLHGVNLSLLSILQV